MRQIIAILFFALAIVQAEPQIGGMVRNYTALLAKDNPEFAMLQNTFHLTFEQRGGKGALFADIYAYQYGKDVVPELNMKQLYVDLSLEKIDFRLGRQQIIWGKADGVFITDVVSPRDLREFLLPDFTEIRQGIDGLNSSFYVSNHTFSLVLSPAFRPTVQPEQGSIWRPELSIPGGSFRLDTSMKDVAAEFDNSEAFFRWSAMLSAIDFELVAAWMWDDDPALHLTKYGHPTSTGFVLDSAVVTPRHHRLGMGGGSFSTTHNGFVFKGEAGYYSQKRFRTADPALSDGITEGDYLHYMAGVSYTLLGVDLHTQFIQ
ncbi:MAG: hypothetical protein JNL74_16595, partial [Fibrobacteres bacterium]|nr:hypothetical protein [Fibrobacterota bacterium]